MKKVIITAIAFVLCAPAFSQHFLQAGVGFDVISLPTHEGSNLKRIEFQYGKFVNERKMRAVSLSYNFGYKYESDPYTVTVGSTDIQYKDIYTFKFFRIGYERKVTFGNTEFDDVWNYYSIVNYGISFATIAEEYSDNRVAAVLPPLEPDNRTLLDIGLGLGMGRKFEKQTYGFAELSTSWIILSDVPLLPYTLKFGIRRML